MWRMESIPFFSLPNLPDECRVPTCCWVNGQTLLVDFSSGLSAWDSNLQPSAAAIDFMQHSATRVWQPGAIDSRWKQTCCDSDSYSLQRSGRHMLWWRQGVWKVLGGSETCKDSTLTVLVLIKSPFEMARYWKEGLCLLQAQIQRSCDKLQWWWCHGIEQAAEKTKELQITPHNWSFIMQLNVHFLSSSCWLLLTFWKIVVTLFFEGDSKVRIAWATTWGGYQLGSR